MSKTILVTGSSRGIGAATALLAARQAYRVVVNYVYNEHAAQDIVNKILKDGGYAVARKANVSSEEDVLALFNFIDQEFGTLHALVNNAGILYQQCKLEAMEVQRVEHVIKSNVMSAFICCREAVKRMSTKNGGSGGAIVNVSSIAAKTGSPNEYVDYALSKGAVDALTIGLSKEVADEGIRVNAVRPGFIYTDIHASGGEPGRVDRLRNLIPMKRGGDPKEVASAIMWLLSEESSYVTGGFIDIAGGR